MSVGTHYCITHIFVQAHINRPAPARSLLDTVTTTRLFDYYTLG